MSNTNIAVLITCFNRKQVTLRCLAQLQDQHINHDIFLVDDGCTDGTGDAVRLSFPDVHIIKGDGSLFWNRGMHLAWITAAEQDYKYYLWLNDDTFLFNNAIKTLVEKSQTFDDKAILVGATCEVDDRTKTSYSGKVNGRYVDPNGKWQKIENFFGNFVLIPRWVYKQLGPNDPYYNHCLGDFDYARMANKRGIEMWMAPIYIGACKANIPQKKWQNSSISLINRLKILYSPLGYSNPKEIFHYYHKHEGYISAFLHWSSVHIKMLLCLK